MNFTVVIPARYASSRLPGKPLADICGKPMVQHTWERAQESGAARILIATDDARIAEVAQGFGADVCMTSAEHATGTDRLAEVVALEGFSDDAMNLFINLAGDFFTVVALFADFTTEEDHLFFFAESDGAE